MKNWIYFWILHFLFKNFTLKLFKKGFDLPRVCAFLLGVSISFFCRYDKAGVDWNVIIIQTLEMPIWSFLPQGNNSSGAFSNIKFPSLSALTDHIHTLSHTHTHTNTLFCYPLLLVNILLAKLKTFLVQRKILEKQFKVCLKFLLIAFFSEQYLLIKLVSI